MITLDFRRIVLITGSIFMLLAGWFCVENLFENLEANKIMVIQSPIEGRLDWYTTPGVKAQWFGRVTKYEKGSIFEFDREGTKEAPGGIDIRFNDGGHARILGSVQYVLPTDTEHLNRIHARYGSAEAVERQVVQKATESAIYLVGPLMSSRESYAEKRNDMIHYVMDQIQSGIYRTRQTTTWVEDPITKERRQVVAAEIVTGKDGKPERQADSPLSEFGLRAYNFVIKQMPYDSTVEAQIKQQQQITMDVQTAVAQAKKAEQAKLTAEAEGQAKAMQAKWEQEALKAQAATKAEQEKVVAETLASRDANVALVAAERDKKVAEQQKLQAEFIKQQQILLGEGEAKRKELVINADGALAQKLEAMIKINEAYARAMAEYRGNWVPQVAMQGQSATTGATGAQSMIDLLTIKTARDLGLDMTIRK